MRARTDGWKHLYWLGKEATLGSEHEEVWPRRVSRLHAVPVDRDAVRAPVIHIELQVEESSLASVEDSQSVASGLDSGLGKHGAVAQHRVAEHLGNDRGIRGQTQWVFSQLPTVRLIGVGVPAALAPH